MAWLLNNNRNSIKELLNNAFTLCTPLPLLPLRWIPLSRLTWGDGDWVRAVGDGLAREEDVDGVEALLAGCVLHVPDLGSLLGHHRAHGVLAAVRVQDGHVHHAYARVWGGKKRGKFDVSLFAVSLSPRHIWLT